MVPIEHKRGRPVIRSIMHLYRVNIVVRGEKEERINLREISHVLYCSRAIGPLWLNVANFVGLRN
jgi:hypothetical protein